MHMSKKQGEHGYDMPRKLIGTPTVPSLVSCLSFNEIPGFVNAHTVNIANFVTELNPVALVGRF